MITFDAVPAVPAPGVVLDILDRLQEERDRARRVAVTLEQELARLREQIAALHYPSKARPQVCQTCLECYPCRTLRLVQS